MKKRAKEIKDDVLFICGRFIAITLDLVPVLQCNPTSVAPWDAAVVLFDTLMAFQIIIGALKGAVL